MRIRNPAFARERQARARVCGYVGAERDGAESLILPAVLAKKLVLVGIIAVDGRQ